MKDRSSEDKKTGLNIKDSLDLNVVFLVILTIAVFIITFFRLEGYKFSVQVGDRALEDIRATNEIVDTKTTEKLRKEARDSVPNKYRVSPSVQMDMKSDINNLFEKVKQVKNSQNPELEDGEEETEIIELTMEEQVLKVSEEIDFDLDLEDIKYLLNMEIPDLNTFNSVLVDLSNQVMGLGIKEEDLTYEKENLPYTFESLHLEDREKEIGINIMEELIKPNSFIDEEETEAIRDEAESKIEPVIIKENEIIVNEGEIITEDKLELIKESGLLKNAEVQGVRTYIGALILICISLFLIHLYIKSFNKEILEDNRYMAVLIIIFITILLSEIVYSFSPYLIPVSAGTLLIAVLIEPRLAIATNMILSLFLGYLLRLDSSITFMMIVGGSLGVVTLKDKKDRTSVFKNGLIIGISNALVILGFGLIKQTEVRNLLIRILTGFTNGIIAVVFTIGSLPLWENTFSILTPIKLGELANPNQPLLKRLLLEAPGTYHHSIMVGNLSEAGADVVGADSLLSRVGAYYHDIGKLENPYYFKENQFGMDNPHDKLSPKKSAEIILAHVTDGEKLAKEYRLPKEIVDFIIEHHGTTNVAYFYYLARQEDENADIMDYTYKGRKPQSKETAVVMMADSVEAAVRSIENPTYEKIEDMMNKVIDGKVKAEQFTECDISDKDIVNIKESFMTVLMGIYHGRVSYPEDEGEKEE